MPTAHELAKREEQCANPEQSSVPTAADKPSMQDPAPGPSHATLRGCPPAALLPRTPITCAQQAPCSRLGALTERTVPRARA